ncbi:MAG: HDOD domain-containing protein [Gammaproteobacteria bacterium]|nr:MAG: HDOD domain-containing protein [Gammaproteobacteria bacterium]
MNARDYAEQASDIFVLSDSFIRIKELLDDDTATIDDIADVILLDPALTAAILKLSNSSFFNYPGKIDTISKAMLVLGITEVYNLVIAYFTTKAFSKLKADAKFLDSFWERSVDCALLVKYLGAFTQIPKVERLFVLGLLHNLGELVVQQLSPEKIPECQSHSLSELPWKKQQSVLSFSFGQCSAELLRFWRLPYCLIEPISSQDEDDFEFLSEESKLLYVAKRVMLNNNLYPDSDIHKLLPEEQLAELNLTNEIIQHAREYVDLERFSILALLKPSSVMIY